MGLHSVRSSGSASSTRSSRVSTVGGRAVGRVGPSGRRVKPELKSTVKNVITILS